MLKDVVQPSVKKFPNGIFRNMKMPAPNSASGTEPNRMINGSRKLVKTALPAPENQDDRKTENRAEFAAFNS